MIIAAIFIAVEVFTPGFFLLWFGDGALVASVMALFGVGSFATQMIVFLIVSVALVIASRTIFEKFFTRQMGPNWLKSGVGTMIGQITGEFAQLIRRSGKQEPATDLLLRSLALVVG